MGGVLIWRRRNSVAALARQIASASAQTLALGKPAFYRQIELDRPAAYEIAQKVMVDNLKEEVVPGPVAGKKVMVDNLLKEDAYEGITAFLQKRDPEWKY